MQGNQDALGCRQDSIAQISIAYRDPRPQGWGSRNLLCEFHWDGYVTPDLRWVVVPATVNTCQLVCVCVASRMVKQGPPMPPLHTPTHTYLIIPVWVSQQSLVICKQVQAWPVKMRQAGKMSHELWVWWKATMAVQKQGASKFLPTPSDPFNSSPPQLSQGPHSPGTYQGGDIDKMAFQGRH